ncbi:glycoside hydrolase family 15 protein [Marinithermus hydrothermalis]|uniref:Glycoside hydrolase 15-related protein n=1 Tax=Marinithermus hydrothermalis (strain DSM 14884 / JCM 11576 / T1) TaxID=869210 RepID=F2NM32_MARHT|nr:glycoside hydrolase family 15 protein [Marinithermus hydrothermalis]AEB11502.1 glycoside hydrolase 15-related protein [Marinithermus hydrothermalis DSM 14884]
MQSFSFDPQHLPEYKPLAAYGMIGDNRTAILVGADGSVDWACLPDFDSPAVFAALLDPRAGRFAVRPAIPFQARQHYERGTNILVTEFVTAKGTARLRDFMPYVPGRRVPTAEIHRMIEGVRGEVPMEVIFEPRFGYGLHAALYDPSPYGILARHPREGSISLSSNVPLEIDGNRAVGHFTIEAGNEAWMVADWGAHEVHPVRSYQSPRRLWLTRQFWRAWIDRLRYHGRYRGVVERSLLTLKLLIYEPTGAIVAAPTTSLPEWPGGQRNWDYRYTWVRDSAFMLRALFNAGYIEEGTAYFDWLLQQCLGDADGLQVMYGIRGEHHLPERELPLRGYMDSRPVRIGNGAVHQFQLDIYGSLLDAAVRYDRHGGVLTITEWEKLRELVEVVRRRWREPDSGVWEARSGPQHYTYSKIWAWVALNRAVALALKLGVDAPVEAWTQEAMEIHAEVLERAWNPKLQAFTQAYGSEALDAAVLVMPEVGFLPASDARFQSTLRAVREHLTAREDPLLYRYLPERSDDGVGGPEGAFLLVSFWLVEALALAGDLKDARAALEKLLDHMSPLGLYSEELHPEDRTLLGNFPQGFSHLGLVNAVFRLDQVRRQREGWEVV